MVAAEVGAVTARPAAVADGGVGRAGSEDVGGRHARQRRAHDGALGQEPAPARPAVEEAAGRLRQAAAHDMRLAAATRGSIVKAQKAA